MNRPAKLADSPVAGWRERIKPPTSVLELNPALFSTSWFAPTLAAAVVGFIGLWLAATLNIWIDEAYTIHTTGSGLAYALGQATTFELQPPLYFLITAAWRLIDENSVAFARFPTIAFAAAAAAILVVAARRLAPRLPALAVALAIALNPLVIWAAVEMRVYALVLLIAAALTLALMDGFLAPVPTRAGKFWYAVAGIAGLYTQFYIGFILFAFAVTIVVVRRRVLVSFIAINAIIGLAFLPFIPTALQQIRSADGGDVRQVTFLKALHEMLNANFIYVLPHEISWSGPVKIVGFCAAAALVGALAYFGRPRLTASAGPITAAWALASLIFSIIFAIAGEAPDVRRHAIAIAPLTIVTAFALLSALTAARRPLLAAAALTYVVFAAASLWWLYRPPISKTGDWQRVAALVSTQNPKAAVVIFPGNLALPLGRYLPPSIRLVPFPRPMTFSANYLNELKLHDEAQVAKAFEQGNIGSTPFWIVADNSCDPGPQLYDFYCHYLDSYLAKHFVASQRYAFHGAVATLYDRSFTGTPRN